jgi:hypothetical protein
MPLILGGRGRSISLESEASLVYKVCPRTARATQRNCLKPKNQLTDKQKTSEIGFHFNPGVECGAASN